MKAIISITAIFWLFTAHIVRSQGMITYLSNLGQSSDGNLAIASDSWVAGEIRTGDNVGGYALASIQLAMASATGNPSDFMVMIYASVLNPSVGYLPGSSIGTLSGSLDPVTGGIYTYIPSRAC